MKKLLFIGVLLLQLFSLFAQNENISSEKPYYVDLEMGPYLILDGTIYKSVFLRGIRLGYEYNSGVAIGIEYLAGHQEDLNGQLGTTHSVSGTIKYFMIKNNKSSRFRPFLLAGAGFFEFKDFSTDEWGLAYYLGGGIEMNITETFKVFLEPRYVNTGLLNVDGTNQLGVMWGIRARF